MTVDLDRLLKPYSEHVRTLFHELRAFVRTAASEVGLRTVEMNDDEIRDFIMRNAERVGLQVAPAATH